MAARNPKDVSASRKDENQYIPSFISKKPFYVTEDDDSTTDYLEHQRLQKSAEEAAASTLAQQKWYDRGRKAGPAATKFRKGACENCGALTHKTKECLSRPRKSGARWTGKDIEADEVVQEVKLGWDAKRDRWNGYEAGEYDKVVEEYNALEDMKKRMKGGDGDNGRKMIGDGEDDDADVDEEAAQKDEGLRYEEETDMGRQQSTSTRNLRLREDTAKYLLNLDLDSAKYDPKTRSMVDAGATADQAAALVAEEGFMKASGDAAEFETAQRYAWEKQERGDKDKIHLQANPTSGEFLRKKERQESEAKAEAQRKALAERYGSQEHLHSKPAGAVAVTESERFVEYDDRGRIKGAPASKATSQYPQDVLTNNHKSVWGSWWRDFVWGYACCHLTVKNSYCTGEEGKMALEEADRLLTTEEVPKQIAWEEEAAQEGHVPNAVEDDKAKTELKAKKRGLEEMKNGMGDEDMDEYRKKRVMADDPMKQLLGKDELVH